MGDVGHHDQKDDLIDIDFPSNEMLGKFFQPPIKWARTISPTGAFGILEKLGLPGSSGRGRARGLGFGHGLIRLTLTGASYEAHLRTQAVVSASG